jgi:protoporphyrinogen oxidase
MQTAPVQPAHSPAASSAQQLTVVGGGITGLATAYLAAKAGVKVRVLEGSPNFGGLLNTFEIGGNRLEFYYHHFFTHDAEINWLIRDLGIADKLRFYDTTMGFFRNGKIYDFNGPVDLLKFKPMNLFEKLRWGLSSLYLGKMAQWESFEDVPCLDWFYKYAGKGGTNAIWKPMLDIKFGPYADQVPLAWMVGRLRQRLGSRKDGDEKLGYVDGSLNTLLQALMGRLREMGVELINETPVEAIHVENGELTGIRTPQGDFHGGKFIFTIPTIHMPKILQEGAPELAEQLANIEYFGAVCTILETDRKLSDIYWLNVADEGFPFGGVIEHTNFIPPERYGGKHITYLSRYFAMSEDLAQMSKAEIEEVMIPPLARIYPGFDRSWVKKVHIFRTNTAATVCDLNFSRKVPQCDTDIKNLYLANMAHIYPDERSTNNSIRVAAEACRVMGYQADMVPYNASLSGKIGF